MNDVLMNEKWNEVWMTCKSVRVEFQSVRLFYKLKGLSVPD